MTKPGENIPFYKTVLLASAAGAAGGFVGTPADMVNVRMQNDIKLPLESRRKYECVTILKKCVYSHCTNRVYDISNPFQLCIVPNDLLYVNPAHGYL